MIATRAPVRVHRASIFSLRAACRAVQQFKMLGIDGSSQRCRVWPLLRWLAARRNILILATRRREPVGFALGYLLGRLDGARRMLFLYEVQVAENSRKHGIGLAWVEAMKTIVRQEDVAKMWVQTSPDNTPARALYRKAGGMQRRGSDLLYLWTNSLLREPVRPLRSLRIGQR